MASQALKELSDLGPMVPLRREDRASNCVRRLFRVLGKFARMKTETYPEPTSNRAPRQKVDVVNERMRTNSRVFAHTRWDIIPVAAALLHCAYFFGMFYLFPRTPLWIMLIMGFIYSVSISWNI